MQLVLETKGLTLTKKRQSFLVIPPEGSEEKERLFSPKKVTSIAITQQVNLNSDAIILAVKNQIPILFFDRIGKAQARLWSPYFESIATLRRQQVRFAESPKATTWVIDIFHLKTQHQIQNLNFLKNRKPGQKDSLDKDIDKIKTQSKQFNHFKEQHIEDVRSGLMGNEGSIARIYFQAVSPCLPITYQFEKRSRRPAEDMFNAALNYFYGMLYSIVEQGIFAAGLDPHLGILHADEYKKPILAFDLIEIFRPWVDRLVIDLCLEDQLLKSFFSANQHGVFLNKKGKAILIPRFNAWLKEPKRIFEREATIRNQIFQAAGRLSRTIRNYGIVDPEEDQDNDE